MSHLEKQQRSANAVGGKTVRACDSCLRRRARWYCAADDAFLCQGCDASVHSANSLARRHERLRLKTASSSSYYSAALLKSDDGVAPAWHQGFKRKARTPRPKPAQLGAAKSESLVPDLEAAFADDAGEEEQLLYRVPIFDSVLAEFCSPPPLDDTSFEESKPSVHQPPLDCVHATAASGADSLGGLSGALPSEVELAEFAADMETLLGRGLDDDSFCMEGLGLADSRSADVARCLADSGRVKVETDEDATVASGDATCHIELEMDLSRETLELNFDCGSPITGDVVKEQKLAIAVATAAADGFEEAAAVAAGVERKLTLRLDYEAVIEAWTSCHGSSPWTNGERPQFNPDDCWPDFTGIWGGGEVHGMYRDAVAGGHAAMGDGGREARVTRYREKRRTRLFSKKIRYEVRKLNAEKRPRMKGRFVKRASFPAAAATGPAFAY